jgi:hypothetical protein
LPVPRHERRSFVWDSTETVLLLDFEAGAPELVVGHENYLALSALDLNDSEAILRFVNKRGILGVYDNVVQGWPWPAFGSPDSEPPIPALAEHILRQARQEAAPIAAAYGLTARRVYEQGKLTGAAAMRASLGPAGVGFETRAEFVMAAHNIRDATTAWMAIKEDALVADKSFESPLMANWQTGLEAEGTRARTSLRLSGFLDYFFGSAFEPFRPRLHISPAEAHDDAHPSGLVVSPTQDFAGPVPLYSACALELYNHVAANDSYKLCAKCGRVFVEYDGYSSSGKRRSDSKFHNRHCANAAANRELRSRKKQEALDEKARRREP